MILYIGNKLSKHGNTPTSVETLGMLLSEKHKVVSVSDKQNKMLRLIDMTLSIVKYRKHISYILIDTYSTSNFYYALLCGFIAKRLNIKYIPMLRGGDLPARLKKSPEFTKFLFGNAYMNVAPSGYLLDTFEQYSYKTVYIPNNIEIINYKFKKRENLQPKLLYVRAFSLVYNPQMALSVLQNLLNKFPNASLCMVGPDRDGTLEKTKELCQEMGLDDKVLFTGKLSKEEWWRLSEECDIFINTTNFDNTPVSVMEAMALGLPVVTTNVGGIPYLIEDGIDGLLVAPNDAMAMSKKIEYLILNPEEASNVAYNAQKKVETFDWENVKTKWFKLLAGEK